MIILIYFSIHWNKIIRVFISWNQVSVSGSAVKGLNNREVIDVVM